MTKLQELRKQAKERGLKGYSSLCKDELSSLLAGKRVVKRMRKNQNNRGTTTTDEFPPCYECAFNAYITHLMFKIDAKQRQRKIVHDGELEINAETGVVLSCGVDY